MKKGQTYSDLNNILREERLIKGFEEEFLFANNRLQWKARHHFCSLVKYGMKELELYLLTEYDPEYIHKRIRECRKR